MDELEVMKAVSDKLDKLSEGERQRVLNWMISKYGASALAPAATAQVAPPMAPPSKPAKALSPKKATKKSKAIISIDKSLNLSPSGKKSAAQFSAEKQPGNAKHKCVVAVYYLREFVGSGDISVSSVYTFFKVLGWPLPANLKNMLSQAGSDGWLDTSDFENIQLTTMGENLIEHSLPPKEKA